MPAQPKRATLAIGLLVPQERRLKPELQRIGYCLLQTANLRNICVLVDGYWRCWPKRTEANWLASTAGIDLLDLPERALPKISCVLPSVTWSVSCFGELHADGSPADSVRGLCCEI